MRTVRFAVTAALGSILFCALALAQEVTGNIVGHVTDPSGAPVANAMVSVKDVERNVVIRNMTTNDSGDYSATFLHPGLYSVSVEAPGFNRATRDNIHLTAFQSFTADFHLQIGAVTQQVNVEAPVNQVELQTAQQAGLINGTQLRELALNNRNFVQFVVLEPGVVSNLSDSVYLGTTNPTGGNNIVGISVNGLRQSQNNWTLDGADLLDRGSNITIQQYPSVDAIEEIKVVRNPYSAEFGRDAGAQVTAITRSGTNQLHGDAYEFFRNDQLNANNFFNNANGVARPPLRYNDFGYTLGGPVVLPHIYNGHDKTFFFFSEEFRRVINYNAGTVQIPTPAELQGIFPNPVCVAVSAAGACTQTSTTITNINPIAQQYIKDIFSKLPAPQSGNVLSLPLRGVFNARQEIARIDHHVSDKFALAVRYLHDSIPTIEPGGLFTNIFTPGVATTDTNSPGWSLVIRATNSFSPTLYNEAGYAWSHGGIFSTPVGLAARANSPDINPPLLYPGNPARIPSLTFTGGLTSVASYGPYNNFSYNHSIFDNMTKTAGKHTLKFGGVFYIYRKNENQLAAATQDNAGGYSFANTPRPANNVTLEQAFANFLLGNVATFFQNNQDLTADLRSKTFEAYLQDDIRVKPNFTLNLGLRYSNFRQPTDHNNNLTSFDPQFFNPATAFKIDPATGNRIAGSGDPFDGIIRGGVNSPYGDAIARQPDLDFAPRFGFAWDPFSTGKTSLRGGYGIFYDQTLVGSLEQNEAANPTPSFITTQIANTLLSNPTAGSPVVSLAPPSPRGWDPHYHDPYAQQWDFEIQRELPSDALFSIAYVGTKGTHLIGIVDINQVPPGLAAAAGLVPAGGYINATIRPRLNALRPYQGYNAINMILSAFDSNYNGLQTSLNKRFGQSGGLLTLAYTFSKSITDNASDRSNAPQNSYNFKGDRGLSVLDRRHVFTGSYVYPLPSLRSWHNVAGYVLGGWELSGIVNLATGLPASVTDATGVDPGGLGSVNNGASAAGGRPDEIADPNSGPGIHTINMWFNTAAFAEVPVGVNRPGNAGRFTIQTPGIERWDFSLFKNFPIKERASLQFRGEAFNFLNHTNLNAPNVSFGNPLFGRITTAHDPRQIQLGAKLVF